MLLKCIVFFAVILTVNAKKCETDSQIITCFVDVGIDYFISPSLRSALTTDCVTENCRTTCGELVGICLSGQCRCLILMEAKLVTPRIKLDREESFALRPALRHHIAHFCPSMDTAKSCVKTCMKVGKPAFCGKDHVCYCGHKYTSNDVNSKVPVADIYAQFKDLYAKYFGTNND